MPAALRRGRGRGASRRSPDDRNGPQARARHAPPALPQHGLAISSTCGKARLQGSDAGGRGRGPADGGHAETGPPGRPDGRTRLDRPRHRGAHRSGARSRPSFKFSTRPGSGSRWSATPFTGFRTSARRWCGRRDRGVQINVIVETPDKLEGQNEYSTLRALGDDVAGLLGGLLLAEGEAGQGRQRQGRHPARQVCRGRWPLAVPVVGQPHGVRLHDQHGVGRAGDGREAAGAGAGAF